MNTGSLFARWSQWRRAPGLWTIVVAFLLGMVLFVLANAALVTTMSARYERGLAQLSGLDMARMLSQRAAMRAMRLSDGAFIQTAKLGADIARLDEVLLALDQGGVVTGQVIPPLNDPAVQALLPRVRRDWRAMHGRLQAMMLGSYTQGLDGLNLAPSDHVIERQWIADDAENLLVAIDAMREALLPLLQARTSRAHAVGAGLVVVNLLALLVVSLLLRTYLIRPLRELRAASLELVQDRDGANIPQRGAGELAEVARAVSAGAQQLRELLHKVHEERVRLERSDIIFRGLTLNSLVGIFLADQERFSFVSPKMADIFGYTSEEMVGDLALLDMIVPRERYLVAEAIKASQERRDASFREERRGRRKDDVVIDIEISGTTIDVDGHVTIIGFVQDITARKQAESSAQLAAIAYENSSEAIAITDATGVVIDINPAYSRMTGTWPDELEGELLPLLQPSRHNREFYDRMWYAINTQGRWEGECWGQRASGETFAQRVVIDTAWNHDGSVNCRVAMMGDITEKKRVEDEIWKQAHYDPLTQLPNRQYFNERLHALVLQTTRGEHTLALMFLDLDLFKEVNDSMGHAVGDQLLLEVARRLAAFAQDATCFVARLGGDEFVLIMDPAPARHRLDEQCQTILDRITQPYALDGESVRISASLGVALYPQDAPDAETLMRHVDMAMYGAKDAGRNQFHFFDARMRVRARTQRDLLYSLPQAIGQGQFFLLYQPIYSFRSGGITSAEILLRWRHPEFGVIVPMDFLPYVEERHLIQPLGDWVLREAVEQLAGWRAGIAPELRLSVNLSAEQVVGDRIDLQAVLGQLSAHGLPVDSLTLECSEDMVVDLGSGQHERLRQMLEAGMRFSVGAISVGLPGLLAMDHQPFEALKLEREVTDRLLDSPHAFVVCKSIVALAHRLGLRVVAEGVTRQAQYEFLRKVGCDEGQGFWFDEPLTAKAFEARLRQSVHLPVSAPAGTQHET